MKAIMIVDMPDDADLSEFSSVLTVLKVTEKGYDEEYSKRFYCPLKPMPQKSSFVGVKKGTIGYEDSIRADGWNACIDAILGEQDAE